MIGSVVYSRLRAHPFWRVPACRSPFPFSKRAVNQPQCYLCLNQAHLVSGNLHLTNSYRHDATLSELQVGVPVIARIEDIGAKNGLETIGFPMLREAFKRGAEFTPRPYVVSCLGRYILAWTNVELGNASALSTRLSTSVPLVVQDWRRAAAAPSQRTWRAAGRR
jgi:hypothetical protein